MVHGSVHSRQNLNQRGATRHLPTPTRTRTSRSPPLTSPPLECRCCRLGTPKAPDARWPPLPLLLACAGGTERRREGAWRSNPSCGRCPCKGPRHNTQHMCSDGHALTKDDHTPVCAPQSGVAGMGQGVCVCGNCGCLGNEMSYGALLSSTTHPHQHASMNATSCHGTYP